jgi:hypothetical protein
LKIDWTKVGQIRDKRTMKFFIMTILRSLGGHAKTEDLDQITMMTDSANWFDYRDALAELLETEHILTIDLPEKGTYYVNSTLADEALEAFKREVPAFARGRINAAVMEFRAKVRYDNDVRSSIEMNPDGTAMLTLSIYDGEQLMFSTTIFMPDREQASLLADAFRDDPTPCYRDVMQNLGKLISLYNKKQGNP